VRVRWLSEVTQQQPPETSHFHEWQSRGSPPWALFYRRENTYLIRFIGLADFVISGSAETVDMYPLQGVAEDTLEHLYLNLVEPLALSHRGAIVLHAGAVEIDGTAVLFSGPSGSGKSTMVASFAAAGFRFFDDDGVRLSDGDSGYQVHPRNSTLRLWEDSVDALLSQSSWADCVVSSSGKADLVVEDESAFCDEICPLRQIYFLDEGTVEGISIRQLSGAEAMIKLASHSFMLDVSDKKSLARKFESISKMAVLPIFFGLAYPRRYESLPEVREAVVQHLRVGQWAC